MALVEPNVMLNQIMGKIYNILTNGDDTVPKSEDNFFSWATPGIPIEPTDFEFLTQGLTGVVKKAKLDELRSPQAAPPAAATPPASTTPAAGAATEGATDEDGAASEKLEITPQVLEGLRAQDTAGLYMQAENFARLVDFVPDMANTTNNQFAQLSIMNNEGTLSERYEYILRMSQVMHADLPAEMVKKIEKFRGLLTVTKTKKDLIDDSEIQVTEPSPMVVAYNQKLAAYENAALEYNARKVDALAADNSKAVHFFAQNGNILRRRVKAAMDDWITTGFKSEYEKIAAFIAQVSERDMALLKQQYRDDLEKARVTGIATGSDFYFTSLVPGNFMKSSGWTEFTFASSDFNNSSNSSYKMAKSTTSAGGGWLGIFGGGGSTTSASGHTESKVKFDSSNFSMSFKITQVPIVRPWFKTAFLASKLWRFDPSNPEAKADMVSDGGKPPKGLIPAYPTSMICIKDLKLRFGKSSGLKEAEDSWRSSSAGGKAAVSFGPFHFGGSHGRSSASGERSSKYHYDSESQTMTVPGAQVIGYKCHVLSDKSPNPNPSVKEWI
jgi:hypothetical protein